MISLVIFAVVLTIGGTVAKPSCDREVRKGSDVLYNNHCPDFKKMANNGKKVDDYMKCLNTSGYRVYDAINLCLGKELGSPMPSDDDLIKGVCAGSDSNDAKSQKSSRELMCCIITAEVIPMKKTGADKVDISRKCIDQVNSNCSS